jgi:GTP cyclohydrolase I
MLVDFRKVVTMQEEKRFLVDVAMQNLPFPVRAQSRVNSDGQPTVANISVTARIMQNFEARWIDKFIQILHRQRDAIGTHWLHDHIHEYLKELQAAMVRIDYDYPFFVEKQAPASGEKCLVRYRCVTSAQARSVGAPPEVAMKMEIPCITTYPVSESMTPGGLFGQMSVIEMEVRSEKEVFPEDLVELVDRHALAPVFSFLTESDQVELIRRIHAEKKTSVVVLDGIKAELARRQDVSWYMVRSSNFGMLHSYSTVIQTHKSAWVPFSGYDDPI